MVLYLFLPCFTNISLIFLLELKPQREKNRTYELMNGFHFWGFGEVGVLGKGD
jgi:hypothetical protein